MRLNNRLVKLEEASDRGVPLVVAKEGESVEECRKRLGLAANVVVITATDNEL